MPGVPRELAEHRLRVDTKAKPVKEYLGRLATEKRKAIGKEIARLLTDELFSRHIKVYMDDISGQVKESFQPAD